MKPAAIIQAERSLAKLSALVATMAASQSHEQSADAWGDFLQEVRRFTKKLGLGAKGHAASVKWWSKIMLEQDHDQLLNYVKHARNADQYGLEEQAVEQGAAETIDISHLGMHAQGLHMMFATIRSSFLVPVRTRDGTHYPPDWPQNPLYRPSTPSIHSPRRVTAAAYNALRVYERWLLEAKALPTHQ